MPHKYRVKKEYRVSLALGMAHRARHEAARNTFTWTPELPPVCIDHRTNLLQL